MGINGYLKAEESGARSMRSAPHVIERSTYRRKQKQQQHVTQVLREVNKFWTLLTSSLAPTMRWTTTLQAVITVTQDLRFSMKMVLGNHSQNTNLNQNTIIKSPHHTIGLGKEDEGG